MKRNLRVNVNQSDMLSRSAEGEATFLGNLRDRHCRRTLQVQAWQAIDGKNDPFVDLRPKTFGQNALQAHHPAREL
jgi:hypothetical protein